VIELRIEGGPEPDSRVERFDRDEISIGRTKANDLVLAHSTVSSRHARIQRENGRWVVVDQGSTNGTSLNGAPVTAPTSVSDGDRIDIGEFRIRVAFPGAEAREATPPRGTPVREDATVPQDVVRTLRDRVHKDEALGLGPLEDLLADPTSPRSWSTAATRSTSSARASSRGPTSASRATGRCCGVIERIVAPLGRRIDESSPMVDARLKDGSRVNAIIPPLALKGPCITIRKFARSRSPPTICQASAALTEMMADFLASASSGRLNVVVSGGTGSGKTTLLNVLSSFIPTDERIVTIEDAAELKLTRITWSRSRRGPEQRGPGRVTIRDLVRNSLRMRPDRIVVGECRGGEALDMLQAMNTGHDGSLTTLHANTPRDAIAASRPWCSWPAWTCRSAPSASRSPRRSTSSCSDALQRRQPQGDVDLRGHGTRRRPGADPGDLLFQAGRLHGRRQGARPPRSHRLHPAVLRGASPARSSRGPHDLPQRGGGIT
jgi:Flp pilus assembly CpaF family ATPase